MSSLEFRIDDWVQADDPDRRLAYTSAELIIFVDDIAATRLLDTWSRTVTDRARLPLYPLAEWFAANWWRLHAEAPYEGGSRPPTDWRLSHDLPAIGGGYVWPGLRFASDDLTIQISARALRNAAWEPVRHLNDIQPPRAIPVVKFDRAVDELIGTVLCRLRDLDVSAEPLATIWSDVLAERADPEVAEWRRWEARLGYDADKAPEPAMEQVAALFGRAGKSATAEVVPFLRPRLLEMIGQLDDLAAAPGVEANFPMTKKGLLPSDLAPWDAGRKMAHTVRGELGKENGPIGDRVLGGVLGTGDGPFREDPRPDVPIGLGVRLPDRNRARLHFRKRNPAGLRFEAARFLAESLSAPDDDLWLPLTDRATARQKFQRAFAAEFLAPVEEISELIGRGPNP